MIPSCRGIVQHLYTSVFMRQTLYLVTDTSCNCFAPRSTKQPAGSNSLAHKYMSTFIRTEYRTMIFVIWLITQLLQLLLFATVVTVLVALHDTMYHICTTWTLEDASENVIATNLRVFTVWSYICSRQDGECYTICAAQQDVSSITHIRIRVGRLMRSFRLSFCENVKTLNPLNVISRNLKLEKFSKTIQSFQFFTYMGQLWIFCYTKKKIRFLQEIELRIFALLQCTIMGAYSLLSLHSIVVLLLEYKNKTRWNTTFQRFKWATIYASVLQLQMHEM